MASGDPETQTISAAHFTLEVLRPHSPAIQNLKKRRDPRADLEEEKGPRDEEGPRW